MEFVIYKLEMFFREFEFNGSFEREILFVIWVDLRRIWVLKREVELLELFLKVEVGFLRKSFEVLVGFFSVGLLVYCRIC